MNDPFEDRLAALPRRQVPADWRDEILPAFPAPSPRLPVFSWLALRPFFWPHPYAWATVAALWIAILALNFSGPRSDELYATSALRPSTTKTQIAAYLTHLRLQKLLLAQTQSVAPWKDSHDL